MELKVTSRGRSGTGFSFKLRPVEGLDLDAIAAELAAAGDFKDAQWDPLSDQISFLWDGLPLQHDGPVWSRLEVVLERLGRRLGEACRVG